ncbi:MAG: hypothetical protein ABII23_03440 [bacterium]
MRIYKNIKKLFAVTISISIFISSIPEISNTMNFLAPPGGIGVFVLKTGTVLDIPDDIGEKDFMAIVNALHNLPSGIISISEFREELQPRLSGVCSDAVMISAVNSAISCNVPIRWHDETSIARCEKEIPRKEQVWRNHEWGGNEIRRRLRCILGIGLGVEWIEDFVNRYERLGPDGILNLEEIEELCTMAYRLRKIHFVAARLHFATLERSGYAGSFEDAMIKAFPKLGLKKTNFIMERKASVKMYFDGSESSARIAMQRLKEYSGVSWISDFIDDYNALEREKINIKDSAELRKLDRLKKTACVIQEEHLLIAGLENPIKEKYNNDYRRFIMSVFPLLGLKKSDFKKIIKERAYPDPYRMIYRILPDKSLELVQIDIDTIFWHFLKQKGPFLVRTFINDAGKVPVLKNMSLGPFKYTEENSKWRADADLIGRAVDISYDENNLPRKIEIFKTDKRDEMYLGPLEVYPVFSRQPGGKRAIFDVYVNFPDDNNLNRYSYTAKRRKRLNSHQAEGRLNNKRPSILCGIPLETIFSWAYSGDGGAVTEESSVDALWESYLYDEYPLWVSAFRKGNAGKKELVDCFVLNRIFSESGMKLIHAMPFQRSMQFWERILDENNGALIVEGNYKRNDRGDIKIAGRRNCSTKSKNKPVTVKIKRNKDNGEIDIDVTPLVVTEGDTDLWDLDLFKEQVETAVINSSYAELEQELQLPPGMPEAMRSIYKDVYSRTCLTEKGKEELYRNIINPGEIAFEDLFKDIDENILNQSIHANGVINRGMTVREVLYRTICNGFTLIDVNTVGSNVMNLIGKDINLTDRSRIGFIPLILRGKAGKDYILQSGKRRNIMLESRSDLILMRTSEIPLLEGKAWSSSERWNNSYFKGIVEDFVEDKMYPPSREKRISLPFKMDDDNKKRYAGYYYDKDRLKQEGINRLYEYCIHPGDAAFEAIFKSLGPDVLDWNMAKDRNIKGRPLDLTIREILRNAIRRGVTKINSDTVGEDVMKHIGDNINLTTTLIGNLIPLMLLGESAKNLIWERHLYLIVDFLSKKYHGEISVDVFEELFQRGSNEGLRRAVRLFTKGRNFNSYAKVCIEGELKEETLEFALSKATARKLRNRYASDEKDIPLYGTEPDGTSFNNEDALKAPEKDVDKKRLSSDPNEAFKQYKPLFIKVNKLLSDHNIRMLWFNIFMDVKYDELEETLGVSAGISASMFFRIKKSFKSKLMSQPEILCRFFELLGFDVDIDRVKSLAEKWLVTMNGNNGSNDNKDSSKPNSACKEHINRSEGGIDKAN